MDKPIKYYSRKFLNKKEGVAVIECSIDNRDFLCGLDSSVTITDCSRRITLSFGVYEASDVNKNIAKMSLLIDELCAFRDVFLENAEAITVKISEEKANRKKRLAARVKEEKNEL